MKFTVKDDYKGVIIAKKIRAIIDLMRPFTLAAPLLGGGMVAIMGIVITDTWHNFDLFQLFFGVITLTLINAGSNSLNQVTDIKADKINKPYRPIPRGILTKDEALWIAIILYLIAIFRAIWINPVFATLVVVLVVLTITYSAKPFRLKDRLWLNNIGIAIARGGVGLLAGWAIFTPLNVEIVWLCALILTIFMIGNTSLKDMSDIKGDRICGSYTLPVVYGKMGALLIMCPFSFASFYICALLYYLGVFDIFGLCVGVIHLLAVVFLIVGTQGKKIRQQEKLENSWHWVCMYMTLAITFLLFLLMAVY